MDDINIPLQDWISENIPEKKMYWKDSWSKQVCFVRDTIPRFLCKPNGSDYMTVRDNITVISTHMSKSIDLPVYCVKANGDKFIMRNNFFDWKISVETHNIHNIDFEKLGVIRKTSDQVHKVYCEGFKAEWVYKPYADNKWKYTAEIDDDFKLKLFFWLIQMKDKIWEK